MKHLRRINEIKENSEKQEDLIEYIDSCFVDLLDQGYEFNLANNKYTMKINFSFYNNEIDSVNSFSIKLNEITDSMMDSIRKVKLEYPDILYSFTYERVYNSIEFNFFIPKYL